MAKQIMIVVALTLFFAAVGITTAQDPNNVPAAAAQIAPAAAAHGIDINNASAVLGALQGAAANGPAQDVFKNLAPGANAPPKDGGAPAASAAPLGATAAGAMAAAGVVGSLFFY